MNAWMSECLCFPWSQFVGGITSSLMAACRCSRTFCKNASISRRNPASTSSRRKTRFSCSSAEQKAHFSPLIILFQITFLINLFVFLRYFSKRTKKIKIPIIVNFFLLHLITIISFSIVSVFHPFPFCSHLFWRSWTGNFSNIPSFISVQWKPGRPRARALRGARGALFSYLSILIVFSFTPPMEHSFTPPTRTTLQHLEAAHRGHTHH